MNSRFAGLYKKEIKIFFSMPIAYVLFVVFTALSGYFFANIANYYSLMSIRSMNQYQMAMMDLTMMEGVFRPYFYNLSFLLLLIIPLITMRLFAEEKREGTAELLFTFPVSDFSIVSAKFFAAFTVFLAMLAGSLSSFVVMLSITGFQVMPVIGGFIGLMLLGAAFLMLGLFVSALTESQIVAAVVSFGLLLFFWLIDWLSNSVGPAAAAILANISIIKHFDGFSKGLINTADAAYYLGFIFIFFFLSLRILESKHWRG